MRIALLLIFHVALCYSPVFGEPVRVVRPAPNRVLSSKEINKFAQEESELRSDGGYTGNSSVLDQFDEMSYRYTGGRYDREEILFRLRMPKTVKPGRKYPLVVWFHGRGESDDDNQRQLSHAQTALACLAGPASKPFFLLATQCPKDNKDWRVSMSRDDGKGDAPTTIAREIMEAVVKQFPIDEDRISVFGLSSGGAAAWDFVMDSPADFAGLAIASAIPPSGPPITGMNIRVYCCTEDRNVPFSDVESKVAAVNEAGGSALLIPVSARAHDSWSKALRDDKTLTWLVLQKRGQMHLCPPPGFVTPPRTVQQIFFLFGLPAACIIAVAGILIYRRKRESE